MFQKQLRLLLLSCLLLIGFFQLPANKRWFNERPMAYFTDFTKQINNLDIEHRKRERWENDYTFSRQIADFFEQKKLADSVDVLLPPAGYFEDHKIDYNVPEPAVFYYYTGLKTLWANSRDTLKANWMVAVRDSSFHIERITSPQILSDSLRAWKKYPLPVCVTCF